jgi:DNA-binding beta-propeller fold protein YncE
MSRSGFILRNKSVLLTLALVCLLCLATGISALAEGSANGSVNLTGEALILNGTIQERAQMNSIPAQEQVIEPISPAMTAEPALAPTVMPFLNRIDPRTHERVYTSPELPDALSNTRVSESLTPSADSGEIYVFVTKWGSDTLGDGNFKYLRGVAVDSSGNVYVADTDNNRIQKFSSTGTFLGKWGFYGTGDGQFAYPEGVAVDSSGNVYVADEGNNRIQKFSSSGTFLAKWGSYGTEDGQFQYPQGVAVDTSGNVFVTDLGNYRIQKFSSSGTFLAKWGTQGSGDGQFYYPGGVAVDSSGNVYVADTNNDRIQKFSSSGTFLAKWGTQGSGDGQFQYPNGVAVDSLGNVYVADINNNRIQKFSSSGTFLAKWGSQQGSGDEQFFLPFSVTVDSSGNVYVADTYNHRIKKLSPIGTFLAKWGAGYTGDGQFYNPEGVAVDSSGNVYVADTDNKRIQKFSSTGTFLEKWGTGGSGDGQFSYPDGVAVDPVGNIYVADEGNNRIQKFSSTGTFLEKWGTRGSGDGQFSYPVGVAVDSSGNVYVADASNNRIQKFSSSGTFLAKWGTGGSGDGQFSYPVGVAVDSSGNVYVADLSNNRIQKFSSSGTFLAKWGSQQGSGDGQFNYPRGVAVDSSGNVYVADSNNHRIQKFSSSGTFLAKWGIGGTGDGQFSNLHGVAVDSSGYVFVSDPGNYRIQKFAPFTAAPSVINFTATPTSGTAPLTVTFTDHSTNVLSGVSTYNQQDYGSGFTPTISPGISVVSDGNQSWKDSGVIVTPMIEALLTNPSDEMKPLIPALDDTGTSCPTCENSGDFPLMHFTQDQLDEMQDHIDRAPQYSAFNPNLPSSQSLSVGSSKTLLPYLTYSAAERNQGRCGNCWVWASTGALEIDHTVKTGINDRLSIQYFNSKYNSGQGNHWACCGGWLNTFTNWYNTDKTPIPWSNTNANYGDRNSPCENYATAVSIGTISTQPRYSLNSLSSSTIQTYNGVEQATAINNIKSALNANRAVVYSFFYGNSGWNDFGTFWSYSNETVVFDPTSHSGETQTGGHAVLIVGFDDTDPNNHYWIVLNSWGNPSNRPHGLFRLKMNINYDAVYRSGIGNYQQHTFELVNSDFAETPRSWNWSFGDGSTVNATMQHPVHTYTHPGNYTVSLTVTNGTGSNTLVRANYISVIPPSNNTLIFVPGSAKVGVGLTTNYTIVLNTALQGLSGYNITLASNNASIAEIVGVTYPAWASMPKNSTLPADRAWFKGVDLEGTSGTQNITFFTVTLLGDAAGITTLTITPEKVEDREGGRYNPSVLSATLTVTAVKPFPKPSGGFFPEPTDPNHDGKYEDIDGNGWIGFNDVVVLYQNMEAADAGVYGPVVCYDYDNSGFIGFNDVVKLYGMT